MTVMIRAELIPVPATPPCRAQKRVTATQVGDGMSNEGDQLVAGRHGKGAPTVG